jgi:hypothetical protein
VSCGCQPPNTGANYAQCTGVTIVSPEPDATLRMYAGRVGTPLSGKNAWVGCLVAAFLLTRRMIYFKQRPGDCGTQTAVNVGASGTAAAALGLSAAADPEPLTKGLLTGIATVFGAFTAHHVKAVQVEQATLCDVANAYNQNAYALEQLVQAGQYTPPQAAAVLQQVASQLHTYLSSISRDGNAAYGFAYALDALVLFNAEIVYPALYRAPASQSPGSPATPGAPGVIVSGVGPYGSQPVDLTSAINDAVATGNISPMLLLVLAAVGLVVVKVLS